MANVLVDTGQWKLLKHLLASTHGWISSYPITLIHAQRYQQLIMSMCAADKADIAEEEEDLARLIIGEGKEKEKAEEGTEEENDLAGGETEWWSSRVI